jgi:carbon storage regulator
MLVLTRKPEESIQIGENITVTIIKVNGKAVRVGIDAPDDIRIIRSELADKPSGGSKGAQSEES